MDNYIEILAPAGDIKGIRAAINGGADAVYFGGKHFNARRRAKNLTDEEMIQMVQLCHHHGIKVYVTFNILIKDEEIESALSELDFLVGLDLDGLIIQDPGMIYLLRTYYPHLPLQTSTQGSVYGLDGTLFFQELGFSRVVLPREMGLDEISFIREHTEVELKIFGHGALCYAYSGQCLMSSLIGGRSGNRGLCAQPCRKMYTLLDPQHKPIKKGYLMSMKDLNTIDDLDKIKKAGVTSLKIEGRMKSPEYIYCISRAYSQTQYPQLDGPSIGDTEIAQVFNRDFTNGWIMGNRENINEGQGRNQGVHIGKVCECKGKKACISLLPGISLSKGDGIAFGYDSELGMRITDFWIEGHDIVLLVKYAIKKGTPVFRSYDSKMMAMLHEAATKRLVSQPRKGINIQLELSINKPVLATVEYDGHTRHLKLDDCIPSRANNRPLDYEMIYQQMSKLGDTSFQLENFDLKLGDSVFLPKSGLNAIRRSIVESLTSDAPAINVVDWQPVLEELNKTKQPICKQPIISMAFSKMPANIDWSAYDADEFVLPMEEFADWSTLLEQIESLKALEKTILLATPKVMNTTYTDRIRSVLPEMLKWPHDGFLVRNYEGLHLLRDFGKYIEADTGLHVFNRATTEALTSWGCQGAVISPELTGHQVEWIAKGAPLQSTITVYGRQELMVSANCVINCKDKHCDTCNNNQLYYLEDSYGAFFPIRRDALGYTHIYNADKLFLKSELRQLKHVSKWRIDVTDESMAELAVVSAFYRSGCTVGAEEPNQYYDGRFTKGNFKRGVE